MNLPFPSFAFCFLLPPKAGKEDEGLIVVEVEVDGWPAVASIPAPGLT